MNEFAQGQTLDLTAVDSGEEVGRALGIGCAVEKEVDENVGIEQDSHVAVTRLSAVLVLQVFTVVGLCHTLALQATT